MILFRIAAGCAALAACAALALPETGHARSHAHHRSAHARGGTHLYVFLGLGNNSPGLAEWGYRMQRAGIRTTVANHGDEPSLAAQAIEEYKSGRTSSIKIVGHSLGGGAASDMAATLGQAGVPVQLVVSMDPPGGASRSPNVRRFVYLVPRAGEDHSTMIVGQMRQLNAYVMGR
ncbi:MAG: hypothetical protein EKK40_04450 [Bradyrhizobiaceae bacterium]|nr:MAG: hypothetical protein EKK40_04450 [Bradyrhizobiaceae bacterium]